MQAFRKPTRRTALIAGAAGLALVGAVGVGTAAMADDAPTPSPSATASGAPTPGTPGQGARQHAPHIGGDVQSVSGSTVTVKDRDGFTRTIELASDVAVTKDGADSSVSAIVQGVHIEATGTVASNGTSLDATSVSIGEPAGPKGGPGRHGGGPRPEGGPDGRGPGGEAAPTPPTGTPSAPSTSTPSAAPTSGS